jgi:hypothetical protein
MTASERIREARSQDETREVAIELLRLITNHNGWNEGTNGELAQVLADFVDPDDAKSIAALVL